MLVSALPGWRRLGYRVGLTLATAVSYANRCGDTGLAAWAYGAQRLVARHTGNLTAALT